MLASPRCQLLRQNLTVCEHPQENRLRILTARALIDSRCLSSNDRIQGRDLNVGFAASSCLELNLHFLGGSVVKDVRSAAPSKLTADGLLPTRQLWPYR